MFCLRSYLVLLFLPINASPIFIVSFFILTYLLNRPCVYCSILLLILFVSSCYWSDQCFFDLSSNWFEPRHLSAPLPTSLISASGAVTDASMATTGGDATISDTKFLFNAINDTAVALASAAMEEFKRRVGQTPRQAAEWAPEGAGLARSWMGSWRIPCLEVNIRL